jgi:hypothetical protein
MNKVDYSYILSDHNLSWMLTSARNHACEAGLGETHERQGMVLALQSVLS